MKNGQSKKGQESKKARENKTSYSIPNWQVMCLSQQQNKEICLCLTSSKSSLTHRGIGVPQYLFLEMAQSRASFSQLPNRFSRTNSGTLQQIGQNHQSTQTSRKCSCKIVLCQLLLNTVERLSLSQEGTMHADSPRAGGELVVSMFTVNPPQGWCTLMYFPSLTSKQKSACPQSASHQYQLA